MLYHPMGNIRGASDTTLTALIGLILALLALYILSCMSKGVLGAKVLGSWGASIC